MSDLLKRLDDRSMPGNLYSLAAAHIREQRALLDECESILKEAAGEVDWPILNRIEATLAKLRETQ